MRLRVKFPGLEKRTRLWSKYECLAKVLRVRKELRCQLSERIISKSTWKAVFLSGIGDALQRG